MSANLDLVRSIYAAWERGDFSSSEWAHPEIEHVDADGPLGGGTGGFDRMGHGVREFLSAWEEFRLAADGFRELDTERVLVLDHRSGRSKTSGLELGQMRTKGARLFHIRDGKVTRLVVYFDRERAFADLGLAPDADAADSP
jgi:ketosteroid isomerase-like protein